MFRIVSRIVLLWSLCLWGVPAAAQQAPAQEIAIGVLANRGTDQALERWGATAEYLAREIPDYRFRVVPMRFDEIPVLVRNALVDFVIVNPAIYVELEVRYGAQRISTLINRLTREQHVSRFGGVIFTRAGEGEALSAAFMEGKRVAAVHATSLGGWIISLRELNRVGVEQGDLARVDFLDNHVTVVEAVLDGRADVGMVRSDILERMARAGRLELRDLEVISPRRHPGFPFLVSTPLYPEWPIAELRHVDDEVARQVAVALMEMPEASAAASAAAVHGWTVPANYQPVREVLRALRLSPYDEEGAISLRRVVLAYWYWLLAALAAVLLLTAGVARLKRLNASLAGQAMELRESQHELSATFNQAAVGIAHASVTGRLLRVNRRLCELSGFSEYELLAMSLNELATAEELPRELERYEELRGGRAAAFSIAKRLLCKGGETHWVQFTVSPARDDDGAIRFLVVVVNDLAEHKALEASLVSERRRRDLILEVAGEGILGIDLEGRHTFVNPAAARLLGYRVEEMVGRPSHSMWHHSHPDGSPFPEHTCPITRVLREGAEQSSGEETFWRKDGSPLEVEFISTPLLDEGVVSGAVVLFRERGRAASSAGAAE